MNRPRAMLELRALEERIVPTTDIILDFDGGTFQSGQGYLFQPNFGTGPGGNTYSAFTEFPATNPDGPGDRNEQLLQIIAGVREDYADFDVRVIWDDQGVNSPFFDGVDTVIMIVAEDAGFFGIASSVDILQENRDTALVFGPAHFGLTPDNAARSIREIIDTISHEAGHTLGLSHSSQADSERRQIVTIAQQDVSLDSRFSSEVLNHSGPETGQRYAERARLQDTLGLALPGTTLTSQETSTGQTLESDTLNTDVSDANTGATITGSIDFAGDRDAHRITVQAAGNYSIRQRATASGVAPVFTVWDEDGDFIVVSSVGAAGGVASATITVGAGDVIYVVAGTTYDRQPSGPVGTPTLGNYTIEFGPGGGGGGSLTGNILVGADADMRPLIRLIDLTTGISRRDIMAFDQRFRGGVRVATGDVNGDGTPDLIAAAGFGGGPHVRVFDGNTFQQLQSPVGSFMAYNPAFVGGIFVASGDVNGDGFADIITGAGQGGGPHVRVFSGVDGSLIREFLAYEPSFLGGVTVAAGDTNQDGMADVITGTGYGGGPYVKIFDGFTGQLRRAYFAYSQDFRGGVFVAAGDFNADGVADIVTGAGAGGGSHVRVFNGSNGRGMVSLFAFSNTLGSTQYVGDSLYASGVRVGAIDADGDGIMDIIAGTGRGGRPIANIIAGNGTMLGSFNVYDPAFLGGIYVGA